MRNFILIAIIATLLSSCSTASSFVSFTERKTTDTYIPTRYTRSSTFYYDYYLRHGTIYVTPPYRPKTHHKEVSTHRR